MKRLLREVRALLFVGLILYALGFGIQRLTNAPTIWVVLGLSISVALLVAKAQYNTWVSRVVTYTVESPSGLEPYFRSWGQWLEERGRIVVRDPSTNAEFEYRKLRFATRPDQLVFRFRNKDSTRAFFERVRAVFDRERIAYQLELTPKRQQPRAIAVALDPADVFAPMMAVRLASLAQEGLGSASARALEVRIDGQLRRAPDIPAVDLINVSESNRQSHALGVAIGRFIRRIMPPTE